MGWMHVEHEGKPVGNSLCSELVDHSWRIYVI